MSGLIASQRGFPKTPNNPMRTLICLTLLATVLNAQGSFDDADFHFTFAPPEGLVPLEPQELRDMLRLPDGFDLTPPLPEDPTSDLAHNYYWRDTTGQGREIRLTIGYSPRGLPFVRPDDFADASSADGALTIETKDPLKPPHPGFSITGEAQRPDGIGLHRRIAYFILGQNRFAFLTLTCPSSQRGVAQASLDAALDSVRFPLPGGGPGAKPGGGNGAGARTPMNQQSPQGSQAAPGGSGPPENWGSLEVTGSLVLAVVLLMGLFAGGKRPV